MADETPAHTAARPYREIDDLQLAWTAPIENSGKYYYHGPGHGRRAGVPCSPTRKDINKELHGQFRLGPLLGSGEFGSIYNLIKLLDDGEPYAHYVLKVSTLDVSSAPYLLRKPTGDGIFLYILPRCLTDQDTAERCDRALDSLREELHCDKRRAHGDVSPGNLLLTPWAFTTLLDRLVAAGWDKLDSYSKSPLDLIDPDIGGPFGHPKLISRVLHEDPRSAVWGPLDDLIGLLNTMLLESGVTVERIGGFVYDDSCDYKYGCAAEPVKAAWKYICHEYSVDASLVFSSDWIPILGCLWSADRTESCLMSAVVQCATVEIP